MLVLIMSTQSETAEYSEEKYSILNVEAVLKGFNGSVSCILSSKN